MVFDEDGFHRMDYEKIVVPLVKAVQEQQTQIRRTASPNQTFDVFQTAEHPTLNNERFKT